VKYIPQATKMHLFLKKIEIYFVITMKLRTFEENSNLKQKCKTLK